MPTQTQTAPPTDTHTLTAPMTEGDGYKTIEAPELFQFERPGQEIAGILSDISSIEMQGKKVLQYTVITDSERAFKLLGTYDLVQKLSRAYLGGMVKIRYRGTDPEIQRNGNAMKVFHVMVKPSRNPNSAAAQHVISNDDIPF